MAGRCAVVHAAHGVSSSTGAPPCGDCSHGIGLSTLQVPHGVTCNVGYAEFVVPSVTSVYLKSSSGIVVLGESDVLTFAFLSPWDPSTPNSTAESFKSEFSKLPEGHPLRDELAGPDARTHPSREERWRRELRPRLHRESIRDPGRRHACPSSRRTVG